MNAIHVRFTTAAPAVILDDNGLHLVEEQLLRHAAEGVEGALEPEHHGERRLAGRELDVEQARVAQHDDQRPTLAPGQADFSELELRLHAGLCLEVDDRLRRRARADACDVLPHLRDAAVVAGRVTLREEAHGRQEWICREPLLNQRLERIELLGARRGIGEIPVQLAGLDPVVDRPTRNAQLGGDGRFRELQVQVVSKQHEDVPVVHKPPRPREAAKVGDGRGERYP